MEKTFLSEGNTLITDRRVSVGGSVYGLPQHVTGANLQERRFSGWRWAIGFGGILLFAAFGAMTSRDFIGMSVCAVLGAGLLGLGLKVLPRAEYTAMMVTVGGWVHLTTTNRRGDAERYVQAVNAAVHAAHNLYQAHQDAMYARASAPPMSAPVVERVVERQVMVVRCRFCTGVTPADVPVCKHCGARLH